MMGVAVDPSNHSVKTAAACNSQPRASPLFDQGRCCFNSCCGACQSADAGPIRRPVIFFRHPEATSCPAIRTANSGPFNKQPNLESPFFFFTSHPCTRLSKIPQLVPGSSFHASAGIKIASLSTFLLGSSPACPVPLRLCPSIAYTAPRAQRDHPQPQRCRPSTCSTMLRATFAAWSMPLRS